MTSYIKNLENLQDIDSFLAKPELNSPKIGRLGGRKFKVSEGEFKLKELVLQVKHVVDRLKASHSGLSDTEKEFLKSIHARLSELDQTQGKYESAGVHQTIQRILTTIRQILGNTFGFNKEKALETFKMDFPVSELTKSKKPKQTNRLTLPHVLEPSFTNQKVFSEPYHFWKIEGNNGQISYLLGTKHRGISMRQLHPEVLKAYEKCQHVALENPTKVQSMKEFLGTEKWQEFMKLLVEKGFDSSEMDSCTPREIVRLLTNSEVWELDKDLDEAARRDQKKILELDAPDVIDRLDEASTKNELQESIKNPLKVRQNNQMLNDLSLQYNPNPYDNYTPKSVPEEDILRNREWILTIEPLIKKGSAFIAVGANHLYGTDSLVDLLRKKGYSVTEVRA